MTKLIPNMENTNWNTKSVKELQQYLKQRGVTYKNELKAGLVELCSEAARLGLEIDPDGLQEDRQHILNSKLNVCGMSLKCPTLLDNFTQNIAILPMLSIFDIYNYLMCFDGYSHASFRDYTSMEGYTMAMDGYVTEMRFANYDNTQYIAIKSKVKPRTQQKDPVTKL